MHRTKRCPKCQSDDLKKAPSGLTNPAIHIRTGLFSIVPVTRIVCVACGYCELWIEERADLEDIRKYY